MEINLRSEKESDYPGIDEVNERAFGQTNERALVWKIRAANIFIPDLSSIMLNLMRFDGLQRIFLRYFAVMDDRDFRTSSGLPWATMSPPLSPPSGPRSMI